MVRRCQRAEASRSRRLAGRARGRAVAPRNTNEELCMKKSIVAALVAVSALTWGLAGCSSMNAAPTQSLYQQLGGMDSINKLASSMISSSAKDPRLSSMFANVDTGRASTALASQLCASLGGACQAPYSDRNVASAADRLSADEKTAVSENFSSSLNSVTSDPALREAVTKSLSSKLQGTLASLHMGGS
jgi:truncated hemoglobin YjbI